MVRQELPKALAEKVVDTIKLDRGADENTVLQATLELLRTKDATTDAEVVQELITQWRSGGLGVAGPEATLRALTMGQVDPVGDCRNTSDAQARTDTAGGAPRRARSRSTPRRRRAWWTPSA